MARLFGTDGARGVANRELDGQLAFDLGLAGARVLGKTHRPTILVGRDTRISGDMLESALVAGICSAGAHALIAGVIPTPAVAYLTRLHDCDAGVVISASHNSVEDNGIKFFDSQGFKLADEVEDEIEATVRNKANQPPLPIGVHIGRRVVLSRAREEYLSFLECAMTQRFEGLRVVLDCANGAAHAVAPEIFRSLGAHVYAYYHQPDGININDLCGSTHPERLQQLVIEHGADVGLAFDGDADRLIAVDETGSIVDGDVVLMMMALHLKQSNRLKKDTLVATIMSNMGLELACKRNGITLKRTAVGDRYVMEHMRENGYNLGGEKSGHIVNLDLETTGDGLMSGVMLLNILAQSKKPLSELANVMTQMPQVLVNVRMAEEKKTLYQQDEEIQGEIAKLEKALNGEGRVLVRPSGTEPQVRIMVEGMDRAFVEGEGKRLGELFRKKYGE